MDISDFLVTLVLILLFRWFISLFRKPPRYPPGPPSIPLIGSLPFLPGTGTEKFVSEHVASYGPVTGMVAGSYYLAMINDWKLAKSLFTKEEFSGRLQNYTTRWARSLGGRNLGVAFTDGAFFNSQKLFLVKQLKQFGFGKTSLETVIVEQANSLVSYLEENADKQVIKKEVFATPVINILWSMMAGTTFERTDVRAQKMLAELMYIFTSPVFLTALMMPWVRFFFPSLTGYNRRLRTVHSMRDFFGKQIREHESDLQEDNPRDFMDVFLVEKRSGNPEFTEEQLIMICFDLFGAGFDTTSSTLCWAVLYLSIHPEVQERCHDEVVRVLGVGGREVSLEDNQSLHYCQAVMAEVQRLGQVAVTTITHRLTEEFTLPTGHVLPKDCLIQTNIQKFLTNPAFWDKPEVFNPDRFINGEGKFYKPEYFVPFGHGKRFCLGEPLAKAELFIFFVVMVRRIKFETIKDQVPRPSNYSAGFTKSPNDFCVNVIKR